MRINSISFTLNGKKLNNTLHNLFDDIYEYNGDKAYEINSFCKGEINCDDTSVVLSQVKNIDFTLSEWLDVYYNKSDAIIFIGACGIAVRSIAPFLKDKYNDPAVLVIDELGRYVISLVSGHVGGANELAVRIADMIGAQPVITTATDINNIFAVDVFACRNDMYIEDKVAAKIVSSRLLNGKTIGLVSDEEVSGDIPEGLSVGQEKETNIVISINAKCDIKKSENCVILRLIPRVVYIGVGCRKNTAKEAITEFVKEELKLHNISIYSVASISSIDIKKDEQGIIEACREMNISYTTYTSGELKSAIGEFEHSDYVEKVTGVDNVCERAAVLSSNNGQLLVRKTKRDGMTLAIARKEWCVKFE